MSVVRYATSSYTRLLQAICLIAAALGIAGCVSPRAHKYAAQAEPPPPIQSEARYRKEYVLCPGDQIEVLVRRVPEVSRAVIVRPDGMISLPMLDAVPAAGLTVSELDTK